MHITHIVAHLPFREGTGTACYYNALALRELGCEVTVYAPARGTITRDRLQNLYHYMPCWLSIENAFLTPDILSIKNTDVLHLHFPFIFGSEFVLSKAIFAKIPLVVTYHNDLIGGGFRRPAFFLYNRLLAPLILSKARKVAVTSLDHAASSVYGETIFRERRADLVEVGNGVDTNRFRPDMDPGLIRMKHRLHSSDLVILFVSNLDRAHIRKGLFQLLEALACLPDPAIKLLIAGDGEMRNQYQQQVDILGLTNRVIFAGRIPHDQLPFYYAACDITVVPSRPPESFGLALAEGMASGRPVIGCNIPGVRKVIQDGETGFLVVPGDIPNLTDRIALLAGDQKLRLHMGIKGRERIVEHYTWQAVGKRLAAMYRTILDDPMPVAE